MNKLNPRSRVSFRDLAPRNMKIHRSRIDAAAIFRLIICFITLTVILLAFTSCTSKKQPEMAEESPPPQSAPISEKQQILMDAVADRMNKMEALEKRVNAGKISQEEAGRLVKKYAREFAIRTNFNPAYELPKWAKKLGLTEPQGMKLDSAVSRKTSADNPDEGFDSITLVFTGEYQTAMAEAKRIAEKAKIPISSEYLKAKQKMEAARKRAFQMNRLDEFQDIQGIAYMNYEVSDQGKNLNIKYLISISVDADGELSINAANHQQLAVGLNQLNLN